MATIIDTLITRLQFDSDQKGLKKAEKGLQSFKQTSFRVVGAVATLLSGGFVLNRLANASDDAIKFADSIGIAVEELDSLEFAIKRQGGTVQGFRTSLFSVSRIIGEVSRGTSSAGMDLARYGVSVRDVNGRLKTAQQLLFDLNRRFTTLNRQQQFDLAQKLGIDEGTILLLQTAPRELRALLEESRRYGVLTREQAEQAEAFNDALVNLNQSFKSLTNQLGPGLFSALSDVINKFVEFVGYVSEHMRFIKVAAGFIAAMVIAFALLHAQLLLIPAAFLAITAITEDVLAFLDGQDSVLGRLVEKWPKLGSAINGVAQALRDLFRIGPVDFLLKSLEGFGQMGIDFFNSVRAGASRYEALNLAAATGGNVAVPGSSSSLVVGAINIDARGGDSREIAANVDEALKNQLQNTVQDLDGPVQR